MTQLAICGLGNIGKVHLENLRSLRGCSVVGLFDRNRQNLERLSAGLGIRAYATADELFADPEVDAVVVATPSGSHREYAVRALAAGKHLLSRSRLPVPSPMPRRSWPRNRRPIASCRSDSASAST